MLSPDVSETLKTSEPVAESPEVAETPTQTPDVPETPKPSITPQQTSNPTQSPTPAPTSKTIDRISAEPKGKNSSNNDALLKYDMIVKAIYFDGTEKPLDMMNLTLIIKMRYREMVKLTRDMI